MLTVTNIWYDGNYINNNVFEIQKCSTCDNDFKEYNMLYIFKIESNDMCK